MRIFGLLAITITLAVFCCSSTLWAYTLTFEDVPIGSDLSYYQEQYLIGFVPGWNVIDHNGSDWGTPHSGSNVLMWGGNPIFGAGFDFGLDGIPSMHYSAQSVGAYFSTEPGVVIRLVGYRGYGGTEVASVTIGSDTASWNDQYAEISSEAGEIDFVHIVGVHSADERYHFSMDNLTINPVPEPSSLLALLLGLGGFGTMLRRRTH